MTGEGRGARRVAFTQVTLPREMAAQGLIVVLVAAVVLFTVAGVADAIVNFPEDEELSERRIQNDTDTDKSPPGQIWCKPCACGQPNRMERVVGGWPTAINEYPWVVALSIRGQYYCGGTIINDLYILTAAHCVSDKKADQLRVVIAEHNKATMEETMLEVRKIAKVLTHSQFNSGSKYNNDIALLRLDRRLVFRHAVQPICLPYPHEEFTGALGRVTGWGHTMEGGPAAMELQETTVAVMANSECHQWPNYSADRVTDNMMCAGVMGGGRDTCQGDSGGSLIIEDWQGRMFQAGVVSWGIGCARPNRPGVYTRVNRYLGWLIEHTKDACYCF